MLVSMCETFSIVVCFYEYYYYCFSVQFLQCGIPNPVTKFTFVILAIVSHFIIVVLVWKCLTLSLLFFNILLNFFHCCLAMHVSNVTVAVFLKLPLFW